VAYLYFALAAVLFTVAVWPWPTFEADEASAPNRTPRITVEPRPDGRWAVQKDGTRRASRLFDKKSAAEARGRAQARREGAELIVKASDGRVQRRASHSADEHQKVA
jgi:hypothetical protein